MTSTAAIIEEGKDILAGGSWLQARYGITVIRPEHLPIDVLERYMFAQGEEATILEQRLMEQIILARSTQVWDDQLDPHHTFVVPTAGGRPNKLPGLLMINLRLQDKVSFDQKIPYWSLMHTATSAELMWASRILHETGFLDAEKSLPRSGECYWAIHIPVGLP